jgi:hypothetical protein
MKNLFISYRGNERSRVKEIIDQLKRSGLCHELISDLSLGDIRNQGEQVYTNNIKPLMNNCSGMILLVGDTTHQPKAHLKHEFEFAKSRNWYIFGVQLSHTTGSPGEVGNYNKYVRLNHDAANIVRTIHSKIPC